MDPGFSAKGHQSCEGTQTYDFAKFSEQLRKFWSMEGGTPLDPPPQVFFLWSSVEEVTVIVNNSQDCSCLYEIHSTLTNSKSEFISRFLAFHLL